MSQKSRVLAVLRRYDVVCGVDLLDDHMPRYAARIDELRKEGYEIDTVPCPLWSHSHTSRIASYRLLYPMIRWETFRDGV